MTKHYSLACLIVTFAMLWVPVGQHDFLTIHWMKVGTFMAPFVLLVAFTFTSAQTSFFQLDIRFVALWLLIAYIAHQFEEHWVDLYGNTYAFKPYLNAMLVERLGGEDVASPPLTDAGVFVINTSLVWLLAALAIWSGASHVFPALCLASILLVNAFSHVGAAISGREYNPGLLTSVLIFIPLAISVYVWIVRTRSADNRQVVASLIWGVLAHVIMILGIASTGLWNLAPEPVFFAVLVAWSISPLFIFHRNSR